MDYYDVELLNWEDDGGSIFLFDSPTTASEKIIYQRMADYSASCESDLVSVSSSRTSLALKAAVYCFLMVVWFHLKIASFSV